MRRTAQPAANTAARRGRTGLPSGTRRKERSCLPTISELPVPTAAPRPGPPVAGTPGPDRPAATGPTPPPTPRSRAGRAVRARRASPAPTRCSTGCSTSGSSTSAGTSTTRPRTGSSPSCCCSARWTRAGTSRCTLNALGGSVDRRHGRLRHAARDRRRTWRPGRSGWSAGRPLLLAAGTPGRRHALPHARILLGTPSAGGAGAATRRCGPAVGGPLRRELTELLARHTGRPVGRGRGRPGRGALVDRARGRRVRAGGRRGRGITANRVVSAAHRGNPDRVTDHPRRWPPLPLLLAVLVALPGTYLGAAYYLGLPHPARPTERGQT